MNNLGRSVTISDMEVLKRRPGPDRLTAKCSLVIKKSSHQGYTNIYRLTGKEHDQGHSMKLALPWFQNQRLTHRDKQTNNNNEP